MIRPSRSTGTVPARMRTTTPASSANGSVSRGRRTVLAARAGSRCDPTLRRKDFGDARSHLALPARTKAVLVVEPLALRQSELRHRRPVGAPDLRCRVPAPAMIPATMDPEHVRAPVGPPHGELNGGVQVVYRVVRAHPPAGATPPGSHQTAGREAGAPPQPQDRSPCREATHAIGSPSSPSTSARTLPGSRRGRESAAGLCTKACSSRLTPRRRRASVAAF